MSEETCLFCKICKGEIKSQVLIDEKDTISILDLNPCTPGHTLVIPKIHVSNLLELDNLTSANLWESVKKNTELLLKSLDPQGFTTGINHGKVSGQSILHLHVHIIPRYLNDGGGSMHSIVNYKRDPIEDVYKKIKNNIN